MLSRFKDKFNQNLLLKKPQNRTTKRHGRVIQVFSFIYPNRVLFIFIFLFIFSLHNFLNIFICFYFTCIIILFNKLKIFSENFQKITSNNLFNRNEKTFIKFLIENKK